MRAAARLGGWRAINRAHADFGTADFLQALRCLHPQSALRIYTAPNTSQAIAAQYFKPIQGIACLVSTPQGAHALVRKIQHCFDHCRRNQAKCLRRVGLRS